MSDLATLTQQALDEVAASTTLAALGEVRVRWLGKKGLLTEQLKSLGALPAAERPAAGAKINDAKQVVQAAIEAAEAKLVAAEVEAQLAAGRIDVTATGRGEARGGVHPVTRARLRIESIFRHSGFEIATGPEIEDDFHNFEALNIPADHPARAMHDTFYFPDGRLLRTHTSPVQIRELRKGRLPLAMIMPGRVYRCDYDMTHSPMFHQVEGLVVNENVSDVAGFPAGVFRARSAYTIAPVVFPFHRTVGRSRHVLRLLQRRWLPRVQAHWLARSRWMRHGASERVQSRRCRC